MVCDGQAVAPTTANAYSQSPHLIVVVTEWRSDSLGTRSVVRPITDGNAYGLSTITFHIPMVEDSLEETHVGIRWRRTSRSWKANTC